MTIQKKSLIIKLNTTKQATAVATPAQDNPSVSAPVSARLKNRLAKANMARVVMRVKK